MFWFFLFSVKIQDICLFSDHLVVYEREDGLQKITIYGLPDVGEPLKGLQGGRAVDFLDPTYSVDSSESEFSSSILRFSYSSLKTPRSVYDYDMRTGIQVLKKIETVSMLFSSEMVPFSFLFFLFFINDLDSCFVASFIRKKECVKSIRIIFYLFMCTSRK